jgi:hypothetical protein
MRLQHKRQLRAIVQAAAAVAVGLRAHNVAVFLHADAILHGKQ